MSQLSPGLLPTVLLIVFTSTGKATEPSDSAIQAKSLRQAYASNLNAIESFDVSIDYSCIWIGLDGGIEESKSEYRVIYQRYPERAFAVLRSRTDRNLENSPEESSFKFSAAVHDGVNGFLRHGQKEVLRFDVDAGQVLGMLPKVPSPHTIGFFRFPSSFSQGYQDYKEKVYQHLTSEARNQHSMRSPTTVQIEREVRLATDIVQFDLERLVPKSIVNYFNPSDGEPFVLWKESYKFLDQDGLQVPIEIRGSGRRILRLKSGRYRGFDEYEAKLVWNSVNEKIEESLFDSNNLKDFQKMIVLLDPKGGDSDAGSK